LECVTLNLALADKCNLAADGLSLAGFDNHAAIPQRNGAHIDLTQLASLAEGRLHPDRADTPCPVTLGDGDPAERGAQPVFNFTARQAARIRSVYTRSRGIRHDDANIIVFAVPYLVAFDLGHGATEEFTVRLKFIRITRLRPDAVFDRPAGDLIVAGIGIGIRRLGNRPRRKGKRCDA